MFFTCVCNLQTKQNVKPHRYYLFYLLTTNLIGIWHNQDGIRNVYIFGPHVQDGWTFPLIKATCIYFLNWSIFNIPLFYLKLLNITINTVTEQPKLNLDILRQCKTISNIMEPICHNTFWFLWYINNYQKKDILKSNFIDNYK